MINRVNMDKLKEVAEIVKNDPSMGKKTVEIEGKWRLNETGPLFESKVQTENGGVVTIQSDEPLMLGGGGSTPSPMHYLIYGVIACYASSYAKLAAMEDIVLKSFKVKATANMDITKTFGLTQNPILSHLKLELMVDTDASIEKLGKLNEIAKDRCPGYYCITNQIFPEIEIIKQ